MSDIDKKILNFIKKHHVFTLATSRDNKPYCSTMFYVFLEKEQMFVFTSDNDTKHIEDILVNKNVAGAIALETSIIGKIQGIQFTGKIEKCEGDFLNYAKKIYLKRFPVAVFAELNLWSINVDFIKLTDNRLGFGKKLIWEKPAVS
ncbi:MAG: pyridoxamine 5'-phosphate oxidase family protein [Bacteroidales bacterium]|nr:pyridoxamine 5'-phosphate oxidase family protein [Bacteroidales bacterium]